MLKISLTFKKFTNFTGERTLRIKNAKLSGYCFYITVTQRYREIFKSALVYLQIKFI